MSTKVRDAEGDETKHPIGHTRNDGGGMWGVGGPCYIALAPWKSLTEISHKFFPGNDLKGFRSHLGGTKQLRFPNFSQVEHA